MALYRLQLTSTVLVTAVVVAVPVGRGTVADLLPVAIGVAIGNVLVQALCMLAVLTPPALRRLTRVTPRRDDDLTHPTHSPR